MYMANRVINFV